jgi:hypothetical protein
METREPESKSATSSAQKQPERKRRFQVVKLEERIAPSGVTGATVLTVTGGTNGHALMRCTTR